jgi:hypothetical protein
LSKDFHGERGVGYGDFYGFRGAWHLCPVDALEFYEETLTKAPL